jgi:hypothetical protein
VYAMYLHLRPTRAERAMMTCSCLPATAAA